MRRTVLDKVDGSLHRIEISVAIGRNNKTGDAAGRRSGLLCLEGPELICSEASERTHRGIQDARIDLHDIPVAILQNVVMRINRRHVAMNNDWIEVKILETADGRELIVVQVSGRYANRGRCGGRRGRDGGRQLNSGAGRRSQAASRIGAGRNAHVERVDKTVTSCVVDPNLARLADGWSTQETDDEMSIGVDANGVVRRIYGDTAGL